jgi:hypothetical protein
MTDDTMAGTGKRAGATPASRSLTGSVPAARPAMASGTADLRRRFGASMAATAQTGPVG